MPVTTFGRVTLAGLLVALAVGCDRGGPGSASDAGPGPAIETTVAPDPATSTPATSTPATPLPTMSTPATPLPMTSIPATPAPPTTNLVTPSPDSDDPPEVAWVPPGPGSSYPYETYGVREARWHKAFDNRDCAAIAALGPEHDQRQLYAGLGDACRAVRQKNDRLWTSAEVALRRVNNPADCLDQLAVRLLRDLVIAHRRAPHANIRIVDPEPGEDCGSDDPSPPPTSVTPSQTSVPRPSPGLGG